jgi:hypothetical protein
VPEDEVPKEIKDLLVADPSDSRWHGDEVNAAVIEAFRRGQHKGA